MYVIGDIAYIFMYIKLQKHIWIFLDFIMHNLFWNQCGKDGLEGQFPEQSRETGFYKVYLCAWYGFQKI